MDYLKHCFTFSFTEFSFTKNNQPTMSKIQSKINILSLAPPSGSTGEKKRRRQQVGVLSKSIKTAGCNSYTAISHAWRM